MKIPHAVASENSGAGFGPATPKTWLIGIFLALFMFGCGGQQPSNVGAGSATGSTSQSTSEANNSEQGLKALNDYRELEKLDLVVNDPTYGKGDRAHAYYLVMNYKTDIKNNANIGINFHMEDPKNKYYTYDGFVAGQASDVVSWQGEQTASEAIDGWILAVFHRFPLLNPQLHKVGYGEYCEDHVCAAALNIHTDADSAWLAYNRRLSAGESLGDETDPTAEDSTVEFPPDGSATSFTQFDEHEWPDPLSGCPGYEMPNGPPISVQVGAFIKTRLDSYSITANGVAIETCGIDSESYTNPERLAQQMGQGGLEEFGAVILIPRKPLIPGTVYQVMADINGTKYRWSFKAAGRVTE
jgi:hypothetical protein